MKTKVLFCLPTYNNPTTVVDVALALLSQSANDLLVVDDGSHASVEELFAERLLEAQLAPDLRARIFHLRRNANMGKGMAIREAFPWAIARGYTHLVSVDADGQHPASEALKLLRAIETYPWALIIGHRNMEAANVPPVSKFGRKFSNFWVRYQTNQPVLDSQSGLRAYPLFHVQNLRFFTRRYDFEIEILIRMIWRKVQIVEIPVAVIYHAPELRVSHFRKFWDNLRISSLNAILVVVSLIREPGSSLRLASAIGLGVWIGCLPLYGLHALIAAAVSFMLKLNFVALVVGTQISIPPLLPVLVPASFKLGRLFFPSFNRAKRFLLGSLVLGTVLGVATFLMTWLALVIGKTPLKRRDWKGEQRGGRLGNWILKTIVKMLGLRVAYACVAIFVVPYFYLFVPRARRAANEYWKVLRPDSSHLGRQRRIAQHMYRFATVLLDSVSMSIHGRAAFALESTGYAELSQALALGRGVLLVSAHVGAWELSARSINRHEIIKHLHVVRYEGEGLTFAKVQAPTRDYTPIATNRTELPVLEIREALRRGEIVSMMGDRPVTANVEIFNFCGKLVLLDLAPFRIAVACRSPVFYAFGLREGYKHYSFCVGELTAPPELGKDAQIEFIARAFLRQLEIMVKKYPNQWFNWFPYFSHSGTANFAASGPIELN